jgi:outer membrane protein TolC
MKKILYKKLFTTLIALGSFIIGYSQQHPDSLLRYLEIAAKNNPTVLQKFSEYQATLQRIPQVGSLSDPQLSVGVFLKPMELLNGNQVADIRLMQMFPWFGVLKYAKDEMSLMANAKFELFRDAKLQVFYEMQRTWYDLYKVQKAISISEKNIEILKIIERLTLIRFKAAPTGSTGPTVPVHQECRQWVQVRKIPVRLHQVNHQHQCKPGL